MVRFRTPSPASLLWLILFLLGPALLSASSVRIGDHLELVTRSKGVPIHDEPRGTNDFRRVAVGTSAEVLEVAGLDGRWLRLHIADDPGDDRPDWVHRKYVARVSDRDEPSTEDDPPPVPDDDDDEARVFASLEGCRQVVIGEGRRMEPSVSAALRVGSWNLDGFPRGCPAGASANDACLEQSSDIAWLACTIAWMDLEVLAVQGVSPGNGSAEMLRELEDQLDELTGGSWHDEIQPISACSGSDADRSGFLWNRRRVVLAQHQDLWQTNGAADHAGEPCAGGQRPGRYARAQVEDGVDLQIVSLQLPEGLDGSSFAQRRVALSRLSRLEIGGKPVEEIDADILLLGDFGSVGTLGTDGTDPDNGGSVVLAGADEVEILTVEVGPKFRVLGVPECTTCDEDGSRTVDFAVASTAMQEAPEAVRLSGYCVTRGCGPLDDGLSLAHSRLSAHCPLIAEIRNLDLDPPPVEPEPPAPPSDPVPELDEYYLEIDDSSAESLRRTLNRRIRDHRVFPYSHSSKVDTWDILEEADADPTDPRRVLDVYKNASYTKVGGGNNNYNREHTWPKGLGFRSRNDPPHTDCHHLFISDINYNQDRNRAIFDNCDADCLRFATRSNAGTGGNDGPFPDDDNWLDRSGGQSVIWQVWNERRGDVARAMFYMDVRYEGDVHRGLNRREPDLVLLDDLRVGVAVERNGITESRMGDLCTLLEWHRADPPDDRERRRNDVISRHQENRNPFIDRPEWAEVLFGTECP